MRIKIYIILVNFLAKFKTDVSRFIGILLEPYRKKKFANSDEFKHFVRKVVLLIVYESLNFLAH